MKYSVLGTGMVGQALASKLVSLGHEVMMGSRSASGETAQKWAEAAGDGATVGTFQQAAAFGSLSLLAVKGEHALSVATSTGDALDGKVLIDITNPLDFSRGFPPRLSVCNDDSLGEQIQRALPKAHVVKALNTLANPLMVDPAQLGEATDTFVAGNDDAAKTTVKALLQSFGHGEPIDMGGIEASRALEAWLLLWTRLFGLFDTPLFNLKLVRTS